MSARKPRAHLFNLDGGGMVTGTHNVAEARRLIVPLYAEEYGWEFASERHALAAGSANLRARDARLETGRIVPTGPDHPDGYSWFWRSGYTLGKPGVTRAVVWS